MNAIDNFQTSPIAATTLQAFRNTLPLCTTDRSQKHNCDTFGNRVPRSGFCSGAR
jgi:hypothetical protein